MCYFGSPRIFRLKAQISEISAGNVDKQALLGGYQAPKAASFKSSVSSAVFFFVHPNPSGRGGRLRAPHAPNGLCIKPRVSTRTVSGLTWALQGTKENTGGILPCWQPSKIPQLGPRASRDKAGVCRSSAALPTFPTLGIYSALCHENLNFKRGILQLERRFSLLLYFCSWASLLPVSVPPVPSAVKHTKGVSDLSWFLIL